MKILPYIIVLIIYGSIYLNATVGIKVKVRKAIKEFKSFKSLKKMMKAISATQTAAAVIDEIGLQDHQTQ